MFNKSIEIPIGSDHAGFKMKQFILDHLTASGYKLVDLGTYSEESVDYPDFIHPVAKSINDSKYPFGIIICGSGQGAAMTANKYPNVRAGLAWELEQVRLIRLHNNANIIALPGRFIEFELAGKFVEEFLHTEFEGGRHNERINKISVVL
jgi:ribose 5-phosphate isomerase B